VVYYLFQWVFFLNRTHPFFPVGLEKFDATVQNLHVTTAPDEQLATTTVIMIPFPSVEAQTKLPGRANALREI
jgi:hypothetical protein